MSKKLITACMALAAFAAFAVVPSLASAKPVITHPTGTVLATPTKITATNIGETEMVTSIGTLKCSTATLTGTLTTNSTAAGTEGTIESATFAGTGSAIGSSDKECTGGFGNAAITPNPATNGLPWCLEATEANDKFNLRGGSCAEKERAIRFTIDLTVFGSTLTCNYERTTAATGTLTTDTSGEDAQGGIVSQNWPAVAGNPFGCPSNGELTMKFTLETDQETASPMYISS